MMLRLTDPETKFYQTPTGIIIPITQSRQKWRPKAFSLFSGAGGMDVGFIEGGFEIVGANEWDPYAAITYMSNLCSYPVNIHFIEDDKDRERLEKALQRMTRKREGETITEMPTAGEGYLKQHPEYLPVKNFWFGDVRKLKGEDILKTLGMQPGDIDCVMGGPPCQGFSVAGRRNIADPRNNLMYEFARLINELQPKTFMMENVPAITSMFDPDGVLVVDKFCYMLSAGGYGKWDMIKRAITTQAAAIVPKAMQMERDPVEKKKTPAMETLF